MKVSISIKHDKGTTNVVINHFDSVEDAKKQAESYDFKKHLMHTLKSKSIEILSFKSV